VGKARLIPLSVVHLVQPYCWHRYCQYVPKETFVALKYHIVQSCELVMLSMNGNLESHVV